MYVCMCVVRCNVMHACMYVCVCVCVCVYVCMYVRMHVRMYVLQTTYLSEVHFVGMGQVTSYDRSYDVTWAGVCVC